MTMPNWQPTIKKSRLGRDFLWAHLGYIYKSILIYYNLN